MGNFGQSMPQADRTQLPQSQSGQMIANSLQNVSQVADQFHQEQVKKDNLEASIKVSQFGLDAENMGADYRQKVASGQMSSTDADLAFSKDYGLKIDELTQQLPKTVRENYKKDLANYGLNQVGTFYQTGRNTEAETAKTSLKMTIDNASKLSDVNEADKLVQAAFLSSSDYTSPSEKIELYGNYRYKQQSNQLGARLAVASSVEDFEGIKKDLSDETKYPNISGEARNSSLKAVESGIVRIQKQMVAEQNKRESKATTMVSGVKASVLSGGAIDLNYFSDVAEVVKGTEAEEEFNFWQNNYVSIHKFLALDTNGKKAQLDKMEQEFKNNPSDNASYRKALLGVYRGAYNDAISSAKSDGATVANNLGFSVNSFTGSELINNPNQTVNTIIGNLVNLNQAKKHEPNINLNPIAEQNKLDIQQSFANAKAPQQLNVLAEVMKQTKLNNVSPSAALGIINTIGGGDKNYNIAAIAVANNLSYQGKSVGSIILNGANSIKSGNQITPSILEDKYREKISNLATDGDFNANWTAFKSAYAYFESQAGHTQKSKDDVQNDDSFNKAMNAVTGGIYQQHNTDFFGSNKFKTSNGTIAKWMVQKPYQMSDSTFENAVNSGIEQVASRLKIDPVFIKDNIRLKARDGSSFDRNVVYDLLDADGKRWTVNGKHQMIIITNKQR